MIIQNAIQVNDEFLVSTHVHDYKQKIVKVGKKKEYLFMVDGGTDYLKASEPTVSLTTLQRHGIIYRNLRLTSENTFDEILNKLLIFDIDDRTFHYLVDLDILNLERIERQRKIPEIICYFMIYQRNAIQERKYKNLIQQHLLCTKQKYS